MNAHTRPRSRATRAGLAGVAVAVTGVASLLVAGPAQASTASQTVTAGTLAFATTPGNITLGSVTLNGTDQTATGTLPLDVADNTGSGSGWNVTATSTTFSTGGATPRTLATGATTVGTAPTDACDAGVTCTVATNNVAYPYSLPAAATAPTATKLFNAAAGTGMANQTVTPTFKVAVPANSYAGTYTSTWTISLVSGP